MKLVWTHEKIQELFQILRYVRPHVAKKTSEDSSQDYPGSQDYSESMPNKLFIVRFMILPDPMQGIQFNMNNVFVDVVEHSHTGEKLLGPGILRCKQKAYNLL